MYWKEQKRNKPFHEVGKMMMMMMTMLMTPNNKKKPHDQLDCDVSEFIIPNQFIYLFQVLGKCYCIHDNAPLQMPSTPLLWRPD